ncbi:MAG: hypothetical protein Q7R48_01630 [bacterium]|nr:hypothetical protein [bacterium]
MMLEKIRGLPEGKRKLIFLITAMGIGIVMMIWFALSTIARIRSVVS